MDRHNFIPDEIAETGLFKVMTFPTPNVLFAMAHAADPDTRELTLSFAQIARLADKITKRAGIPCSPTRLEVPFSCCLNPALSRKCPKALRQPIALPATNVLSRSKARLTQGSPRASSHSRMLPPGNRNSGNASRVRAEIR